jgi:hypothetical protein
VVLDHMKIDGPFFDDARQFVIGNSGHVLHARSAHDSDASSVEDL